MIYEESVPRVIYAIIARFGRLELIVEEIIDKAQDMPKVSFEKLETNVDPPAYSRTTLIRKKKTLQNDRSSE